MGAWYTQYVNFSASWFFVVFKSITNLELSGVASLVMLRVFEDSADLTDLTDFTVFANCL